MNISKIMAGVINEVKTNVETQNKSNMQRRIKTAVKKNKAREKKEIKLMAKNYELEEKNEERERNKNLFAKCKGKTIYSNPKYKKMRF